MEAVAARHDAAENDLFEDEDGGDEEDGFEGQKEPLGPTDAFAVSDTHEDKQADGEEVLGDEDGDAIGAHAFVVQCSGGKQFNDENGAGEDERYTDEQAADKVEAPEFAKQDADDAADEGIGEGEQDGLTEEFFEAAGMQDDSGEEEQEGDADARYVVDEGGVLNETEAAASEKESGSQIGDDDGLAQKQSDP